MALVLAGGAARGAYEVGVVQYVLDELPKTLGRPVPLDILCGTSVGAINACALAASADDPARADRLVQQWLDLRVEQVVRFDPAEILSMVRGLVGRAGARRGGFLDPAGLQRIVTASVPFGKISDNLRAGYFDALTVSTTHIASGHTTVFVDRALPGLPDWGSDPTIVAQRTRMTARHALASAAIPFLFPPVLLEGQYHCDGGLRQNVPLSPARRLGASAMLVVSPKYESPGPSATELHNEIPTPLFLLGKTLNALMLDRIENDIDRLQRISALLDAGTRIYGADFVERINLEMHNARPIRPIRALLIRSSANIAERAAEYARSSLFASRAHGVLAALLRRLGEAAESDLLSYLLFDGEFARQLIEVGRADARAYHDELCLLFESILSHTEFARS